jgi:hypothetical protein
MTYGGKQGSRMAHFIGLAGEYVVAKSIGSEVDERIFENHLRKKGSKIKLFLVSEIGKFSMKVLYKPSLPLCSDLVSS